MQSLQKEWEQFDKRVSFVLISKQIAHGSELDILNSKKKINLLRKGYNIEVIIQNYCK